jgi:hypothetical protein
MYWSLRMRVLLVLIIVATVAGLTMLVSMFSRHDSRLGMVALAVLIAGETMATVYAVMQE